MGTGYAASVGVDGREPVGLASPLWFAARRRRRLTALPTAEVIDLAQH